tara:strand:- start:1178 stop:1288 length:111 start_codon:yes stop_codon:yes gene_type:complete
MNIHNKYPDQKTTAIFILFKIIDEEVISIISNSDDI